MRRHAQRLLFGAIFALMFFSVAEVTAQTAPNNVRLMDSLARFAADDILHRMQNVGDSLRISVETHPAAWLPEQKFLENTKHKHFFTSPSAPYPLLLLRVEDFGIRYLPHSSADSLVRVALLSLASSYRADNAPVAVYPNFSLRLSDTIARANLPFTESRQYPFANSPQPEIPSDFFKDMVEPLVVISAAVLTVLLLFTARSQ